MNRSRITPSLRQVTVDLDAVTPTSEYPTTYIVNDHCYPPNSTLPDRNARDVVNSFSAGSYFPPMSLELAARSNAPFNRSHPPAMAGAFVVWRVIGIHNNVLELRWASLATTQVPRLIGYTGSERLKRQGDLDPSVDQDIHTTPFSVQPNQNTTFYGDEASVYNSSDELPKMINNFESPASLDMLPPVHFAFPAPIIPDVGFYNDVESNALIVLIVTKPGVFHRLNFPAPRFFHPTVGLQNLLPGTYSSVWRLSQAASKEITSVHSIDIGNFVIAHPDGSMTRVTQTRSRYAVTRDDVPTFYTATPDEHDLKRPGLIASSIRRLIGGRTATRSSARIASKHSDSNTEDMFGSPSQTVAIASISGDVLITLSRSRVLDVWSLETSAWIDDINVGDDLFALSTDDSLSPQQISSIPLLATSPKRLLRLWQEDAASGSPLYLVVYQPHPSGDKFAAYQINEDSGPAGQTTLNKEPSWVKTCQREAGPGELQSFSIVSGKVLTPPASGGDDGLWIVSLWQFRNQSQLRFAKLEIPDDVSSEADVNMESSLVITDSEGNEIQPQDLPTKNDFLQWSLIHKVEEQPDEAHFDYLLATTSDDLQDIFCNYVFYPERFSKTALQQALYRYIDSLERTGVNVKVPSRSNTVYDLRCQISKTVGINVQLEKVSQTGAFDFDAFKSKLKVEWLKFITFCHELQMGSEKAHAAFVSPIRGMILVTKGYALTTVRLVDPIEILIEAVAETALPPTTRDHNQEPLDLAKMRDHFPQLYEPSRLALEVLRISQAFAIDIPSESMHEVELKLRKLVTSSQNLTLEEEAVTFMDDILEPFTTQSNLDYLLDYLSTISDLQSAIQNLLDLLSYIDMTPQQPKALMMHRPSAFSDGIVSRATRDVLSQRYRVARDVLIMLLFMVSEGQTFIAHPIHILDNAINVFRTLDFLKWFSNQAIHENDHPSARKGKSDASISDEGIIASRMDNLCVSENAVSPLSGLSPKYVGNNLLHSLLHKRTLMYMEETNSPSSIFSTDTLLIDVQYPAVSFLRGVGYILKDLGLDTRLDFRPRLSILAAHLCDVGYPEIVVAAMQWRQPRTAGSTFVQGLAALKSGDFNKSANLFLRAGSAFTIIPPEVSTDILPIIPQEVYSGVGSVLGRYYNFIANNFINVGAMEQGYAFARKATLQFQHEQTDADLSNRVDALLIAFHSAVTLGNYDEAYSCLLSFDRDSDVQKRCLETFVLSLCTEGRGQQLAQFSFNGIQHAIEEILSMKANASEPVSPTGSQTETPNYYHILYAYHISHGDYRNAGSVMYQLGRRLGGIAGRPTSNLTDVALDAQHESYLNAINCLSLVDDKYAYVAIPGNRRKNGFVAVSKRRRMSFEIPDLYASTGRDIEVVTLADIKEEYALVKARQQLSIVYPEFKLMASSANMSAPDIVSLLVRKSAFAQAADIAQRLKVDMTGIFEHLAARCVRLSRLSSTSLSQEDTEWLFVDAESSELEGPVPDRAWKLLNKLLEEYDTELQKYRKVALEGILNADRFMRIPRWLTRYFAIYDPPVLLRAYIKSDLLDDATHFAIQTIRSQLHLKDPLRPQTASRWLPYTLIDQLLRALNDAKTRQGMLHVDVNRLQSNLESELNKYFSVVDGVQKQIITSNQIIAS